MIVARRLLVALAAPVSASLIISCSPSAAERIFGPPTGVTPVSVSVTSRPYGLAVGPGWAVVTQLDAGTVTVVATEGEAPVVARAFSSGAVPTGTALSGDGRYVLVASQADASVTLHDGGTGAIVARFAMRGNPVRALFSPDGSRAYALSTAGDVIVIDVSSRQVMATITTGLASPTNGMALAAGVLYVSSQAGGVTAIQLASNAAPRTYPLDGRLQEVVVSPDRQLLYVADESGRLIELTLASGALRSVPVPGAFGMATTGDGAQVWITEPREGQVAVVERATLTLLRTIRLGGASQSVPRRIAFDRSTAVVTDEAGFVHVIR